MQAFKFEFAEQFGSTLVHSPPKYTLINLSTGKSCKAAVLRIVKFVAAISAETLCSFKRSDWNRLRDSYIAT